MELNGIANIKMIIELHRQTKLMHTEDEETFKKIEEQLDTLERYMLACHHCFLNLKDYPYWHEVRDNKDKYPNLREWNNKVLNPVRNRDD